MKTTDSEENEILRLQFLKEFSTFSDEELIKNHNNYVDFDVLNPFLILRYECFRKELIRRGFDLKGIATFNPDGRLKSYNNKDRIFMLKINNKKIIVPYPRCLN
jgi:hypothetical protein